MSQIFVLVITTVLSDWWFVFSVLRMLDVYNKHRLYIHFNTIHVLMNCHLKLYAFTPKKKINNLLRCRWKYSLLKYNKLKQWKLRKNMTRSLPNLVQNFNCFHPFRKYFVSQNLLLGLGRWPCQSNSCYLFYLLRRHSAHRLLLTTLPPTRGETWRQTSCFVCL